MASKAAPQPTLEEQIETLQAQVAQLLETGVAAASTAARQAQESGAAAAAAARDRAEFATAGLAEEVRARPLTSLAMAAAIGWFIGRVVSR